MSTDDTDEGDDRNAAFVQSLERGLAVICTFDADHPSLTLADVARSANLTRATARRFLLTLVDLGYVRSDGKYFWLRPRTLELGYAYLSSLNLSELALPHMEDLANVVNESSSLSVLDGSDVRYVARIPVRRIMTVSIDVGTRFPAAATSMGRVLLAHLPEAELDQHLTRLSSLTPKTVTDPKRLRKILAEIRQRGYALVDEELEMSLRSVAVPVRDASGRVVAALNLSTHVSRGSRDSVLKELLDPLRRAAENITADLVHANRQIRTD